MINAVTSGSRDWGGKLAERNHQYQATQNLKQDIPSRNPTSTSFSSLAVGGLFSFVVSCSLPAVPTAAGVVRARLGGARFGRSGVGLLSILSSRSSSSGSCLLLVNLVVGCMVCGGKPQAGGCEWGAGQPCIMEGCVRPNPKPSGEGECPTGPGWNPTWRWGCVTTFAIV